MRFAERNYRDLSDSPRWKTFRVKVHTSDLLIKSPLDLSREIREQVVRARDEIEKHMEIQPAFRFSFSPVPQVETSSSIVKSMYEASELAQVGPMAAVAGAVASEAGAVLEIPCSEYIIENGGDLLVKLQAPATVSLHTENFHFKGRLALMINPAMTPCGICTSSAKIGPSFSYGNADAATVIHKNPASADALATALCGMVKSAEDIEEALAFAMDRGALAALIVMGDRLGASGMITLTDPAPAGTASDSHKKLYLEI